MHCEKEETIPFISPIVHDLELVSLLVTDVDKLRMALVLLRLCIEAFISMMWNKIKEAKDS